MYKIEPHNRLLISLFYVSILFGTIGGVLNIVAFLLIYFLDKDPVRAIYTLNFIMIPLFIFFGTKEYKANYNMGKLKFWQGISIGLITYMTISLISAFFTFIFFQLITPPALTEHITYILQIMSEKKDAYIETTNEETYLQLIEGVKNITAAVLAVDDICQKTISGILFSIVFAIGLRS